jgi:hypothetical protein
MAFIISSACAGIHIVLIGDFYSQKEKGGRYGAVSDWSSLRKLTQNIRQGSESIQIYEILKSRVGGSDFYYS